MSRYEVDSAQVAQAGAAAGASVSVIRSEVAALVRHLADLQARSGLTTEQLIYRGRAEGWLVVAPNPVLPRGSWRTPCCQALRS